MNEKTNSCLGCDALGIGELLKVLHEIQSILAKLSTVTSKLNKLSQNGYPHCNIVFLRKGFNFKCFTYSMLINVCSVDGQVSLNPFKWKKRSSNLRNVFKWFLLAFNVCSSVVKNKISAFEWMEKSFRIGFKRSTWVGFVRTLHTRTRTCTHAPICKYTHSRTHTLTLGTATDRRKCGSRWAWKVMCSMK